MNLSDDLLGLIARIEKTRQSTVDTLSGTSWDILFQEPHLDMIAVYTGFVANIGARSDADWYHLKDEDFAPVLEILAKENHVQFELPGLHQQYRMHQDSFSADTATEITQTFQYGIIKATLDMDGKVLVPKITIEKSGEVASYNSILGPMELALVVKKTFGVGNINRLLVDHNSKPQQHEKAACPECTKTLSVADKVEPAGGSGMNVTPLLYCLDCGYHRVEKTLFTTQY